ncbi:DNA-binding response regulator [Acuticoccus sediminis]|uniref:DNA-binding response regulator n=1 Tax=Acuticoccus sediminis TaxID=2184697 RepID=A0A8B2NZG1_9HYPH|nr:response regulator [Acuticoccus sediminis]RAI01950.1 DNA-binding response regulator [Acuticoccus sediminis]
MGQHPGTGEHRGAEPVVVVVDDDADVRASMDSLFRSVGLDTLLFGSAREFMDTPLPDGDCCFVVDVLMPQLSGLELQAKLAEQGSTVPIVFVTGYGDIPMSVKAMKAGAVDFLTKPLREQDLLDAVETALSRHRNHRLAEEKSAALRARFASLTAREREVMTMVVQGLLNKQIAAELGLSEITVKLHRANMLKKMGTRTVADLVRMSESLAREPS